MSRVLSNAETARKSRGWLLWTIVALLAFYVGTHFVVSRWSAYLVERDWNGSGFYYMPVHPDRIVSRSWQQVHQVGVIVFFPVWYLDSHFLGGPYPAAPPLMSFSPPDNATGPRPEETRVP